MLRKWDLAYKVVRNAQAIRGYHITQISRNQYRTAPAHVDISSSINLTSDANDLQTYKASRIYSVIDTEPHLPES